MSRLLKAWCYAAAIALNFVGVLIADEITHRIVPALLLIVVTFFLGVLSMGDDEKQSESG